MSTNLKKFIRVVDSFIQMAIRLCPEEGSIKMGYEKFKLLAYGMGGIPGNPRMALNLFIKYVYPLREMILTRDEKFFLDREIQQNEIEELQEHGVPVDNAFDSILNLKSAWQERISPEDKEKIWRALGAMITLAEGAVNL